MTVPFLTRLLRKVTPPDGVVPDAELVGRFADARDEAAFELLVHRHGPMVYAACRKLLRDRSDAEDAFQAAFLALARKAGSIHNRQAVGAWLHKAAYHAAVQLRRRAARGPTPVGDALAAAAAPPAADPDDRVAAARALHEEVVRLPENLRAVVILCDLEGHTHAEAARRLGRPVGSVSGWLSRAHKLLRARLERRGVAAGIALAVLGGAADAPASPAPLKAAAALASGVAPAAVSELADAVIAAMRAGRGRLLAVAAAAVGLAGVGTVFAATQGPPAPPQRQPLPVAQQSSPDPPPRTDAELFEGDVIPEMTAHLRTLLMGNAGSVRVGKRQITPTRCTVRFVCEHRHVEDGKQAFAFSQELLFKLHRPTGAIRLEHLEPGRPPKTLRLDAPMKWQPLAFLGNQSYEVKLDLPALRAACQALRRLGVADDAALHAAVHESRRRVLGRDATPEELRQHTEWVRGGGAPFRMYAEWATMTDEYRDRFIRPYPPREAARIFAERLFVPGSFTDAQIDAAAKWFDVPPGGKLNWGAAFGSLTRHNPRSCWAEISLDDPD